MAPSSTDPAPNVTGNWAVAYGNDLDVKVTIGGAVYHQTLSSQGGSFTINHQGTVLDFDLDCGRPDVICPSEVWPAQVAIDQRDPTYEHRMWVKIPTQTCSLPLSAPKASDCGAGTVNPECKPVCEGVLTTGSADAFGLIAESGASFDLFLGGTAASNGLNCALLGVSWAHADLRTTGTPNSAAWSATTMDNGEIKTAYAGGCIWAGDPNMTGNLHALVVGATVEITTAFSAARR